MGKDLRQFLQVAKEAGPQFYVEVKQPLAAKCEVSVLQEKLRREGRFPVVFCDTTTQEDRRREVDETVVGVSEDHMPEPLFPLLNDRKPDRILHIIGDIRGPCCGNEDRITKCLGKD